MPKLAHSLNRPVFVAIPAFFGDDAPRRCTLVDMELDGLWFSGDAVNERLGTLEMPPPGQTLANVFFPFQQIVYVFDPAQFAYVARTLATRETPTKRDEPQQQEQQQKRKRASPGGRHDDGRSKRKNSNRTR